MIFFMFGLVFMQGLVSMYGDGVTEVLTASDQEVKQDLMEWFGTLPDTVLTLFKTMTGGLEWGAVERRLIEINVGYAFLFIVFIFFTLFGVTNVVIGVFADHAAENSRNERAEQLW